MSAAGLVREHGHRLEAAARAGYIARGIVFVIIGAFAFKAAYSTGRTMDAKDAVSFVFGSIGGQFLLAVLVLALFAFAAWRVVQAVADVDAHGTGAKGLAIRAGLLGSAVSYATLALFAVSLETGNGGGGGTGGMRQGLVTRAYEAGFGQALTYAIVALLVAVAGAHLVKGVTAGFRKYMSIPEDKARFVVPVCRFGLLARGLTFLILAWLLFTGAASYRSGDTPGLGTALQAMSGWMFGWVALAVTGLGLVAFGIYAFAEARYRRIEIERVAEKIA